MSNPIYLPVMLYEFSHTEYLPWYWLVNPRFFGYPVLKSSITLFSHQRLCIALSIKLQSRIQETICHILFIAHLSYLKFNVHSLNRFKVNIFTLCMIIQYHSFAIIYLNTNCYWLGSAYACPPPYSYCLLHVYRVWLKWE